MRRNGRDILCANCGEQFYVPLNELLKGAKFCSRECSQAAQRKKVTITCLECGKAKICKRSERDIKGRKFCSHQCAIQHRMKHPNPPTPLKSATALKNLGTRMLGKKHSKEAREKIAAAQLGKPKKRRTPVLNLAALKKRLRESLPAKEWRQKVFQRDDYTCQDCGQRGGQLHAHHIVPFSELINRFVEMNGDTHEIEVLFIRALETSNLWDIANGQTLCVKCHSETPTFLNSSGWAAKQPRHNEFII